MPHPSPWGCSLRSGRGLGAGGGGQLGLIPTVSPSHLPAYLVAAFAKRLARLALTAPPEALLMVLPFICNLLRRHPACRVLVHRPRGPGECAGAQVMGPELACVGRWQSSLVLFLELDADPYDPEEEDPAQSRALESSLWELQVRGGPGCSPSATHPSYVMAFKTPSSSFL